MCGSGINLCFNAATWRLFAKGCEVLCAWFTGVCGRGFTDPRGSSKDPVVSTASRGATAVQRGVLEFLSVVRSSPHLLEIRKA